uniref:histidine kinase n=1 Tax=Chromera velia CCMP2878 TaxID=1169474 RepID=A0A0G4HTG8_9ALVE|eukprot:Cvel_8492.t1-p1 / transcript=Cvel_8492.t1 / gene=Cvel_8492 / organism=Chromera_velia_CCMP2878 / gene_product=Ethylene receptor 1, putative / transcript_product=Ethylene receptor 1, putative / location=Cvel_scaffold469:57406-60054(-) / protein_length=774 / sequence_SO=supercontig / SO=protein_coding / is_pseudo=false
MVLKPLIQVLHLSDFHFGCINVLDSACWCAATALKIAEKYSGEDAQSVTSMYVLCVVFALSPMGHTPMFRALTSLTLAEAEKEMSLRAETEKGRDNFVSYIMHEMRNPLYGASLLVVEYLDTLGELQSVAKTKNEVSLKPLNAEVGEKCGRLQQLTGFLAAQFDKMKGVCDDVLQLKKLEQGGFEFVFRSADVHQWVSKVAAQAAPLFGNRAAESLQAAAEKPKTKAEADRETPGSGGGDGGLARVRQTLAAKNTEGPSKTSRSSVGPSVNEGAVAFSWSFECSPTAKALLVERPVGVADFLRLDQVVSNFISNAKKFTKTGNVSLRCIISEVSSSVKDSNGGEGATSEAEGTNQIFPPQPAESDSVTASHAPVPNSVGLSPSRKSQWDAAWQIELERHREEGRRRKQEEESSLVSVSEERDPEPNPLSAVMMRLEVTDTGPGLSQEDIAKLFRPYSQVRPGEMQNGGGTGLGLVICKSFVEAHDGGRIGVKSKGRGHGSTFFFEIRLPLLGADGKEQAEEEEDSRESAEREPGDVRDRQVTGCSDSSSAKSRESSQDRFPSSPPDRSGTIAPSRRMSEVVGLRGDPQAQHADPGNAVLSATTRSPPDTNTLSSGAALSPVGLTPSDAPRNIEVTADVLIVDDDRFCLMACAAAVRRLGFSVNAAEDGDEAVDLIVSKGESFRVVLTDKNMERVDGPAAVRQICAHFTSLTASESEGWVTRPDGHRQLVPSIVGVTGDALENAREEFLRAGAEKVMLKPVKLEDLKALLHTSRA